MQRWRVTLTVLVAAFGLALPAIADCPIEQNLDGGANSYVYALTQYNGQLIAGGDFTTIGGQACNRIARWDGAHWSAIGSPFVTGVRHLTVFNGELIAAEENGQTLKRWNGSTWQANQLPNGAVNCFGVYNNELLLGGQWFFKNGGQFGFINVIRFNLTDGTWQPFGPMNSFGTYTVKAMIVYNGDLLVGGDFFVLNDQPFRGLARWNAKAQQWEPYLPMNFNNGTVSQLVIYNNNLVAAGSFMMTSPVSASNIARWNPVDGWRSFAGGVSGNVNGIAVYGDDLIAGGYMPAAGSTPVNNIARWNDAVGNWQPVGGGVTNCCGYIASVYTVAAVNGSLFAGGWFGFGQESAQRIIAWKDCLACTSDVTGDHAVNVSDLLAVINGWGTCGTLCPADITHDSQVNVSDLLAVINAWGACP